MTTERRHPATVAAWEWLEGHEGQLRAQAQREHIAATLTELDLYLHDLDAVTGELDDRDDLVGPERVRQHLALGTLEPVFRLCQQGMPHRRRGMDLQFDLAEVDAWLEATGK